MPDWRRFAREIFLLFEQLAQSLRLRTDDARISLAQFLNLLEISCAAWQQQADKNPGTHCEET
jgi:hypothetical protein